MKKTEKPVPPVTQQASGEVSSSPDTGASSASRRNLLKGAGVLGAAALGPGRAASIAQVSDPGSPSGTDRANEIVAREALEVLTVEEARVLEAVCDRLIPSDGNGPGAREARAAHYIDRSLASHRQQDRARYQQGLSRLNDYSRSTRNKPFHELIADQQDSILLALQENKLEGFSESAASFFNLLRNHTIEGTFSDPYYGGNRHFVGWDILNYPGVRLGASEQDVASGNRLGPNHRSAYDNAVYVKSPVGDKNA